jgi:hypothetical protein
MSAAVVERWVHAYVGVAAEALGLPIPVEYRAGVERQFARIAAFASLVAEHRFTIAEESAPLVHSCEP